MSDPTQMSNPGQVAKYYESRITRLTSERDEAEHERDDAKARLENIANVISELELQCVVSSSIRTTHGVLHAINAIKPLVGVEPTKPAELVLTDPDAPSAAEQLGLDPSLHPKTETGMVNVWDIVQEHIDSARMFMADASVEHLVKAVQIIANHLKMKGSK